jgi:predicted enzyme related to lactoylglutathione lyase
MARAKSSRKPVRKPAGKSTQKPTQKPSGDPGRSKSQASPGLSHGKICYVEVPAFHVEKSASFYTGVFGWKMRLRGDGATAFDDATGNVSGAFVRLRRPSRRPGVLVYVNVDDVAKSVKAVVKHGGRIVQPIGVDAPEITARFADPAGNVFGLYQQPPG